MISVLTESLLGPALLGAASGFIGFSLGTVASHRLRARMMRLLVESERDHNRIVCGLIDRLKATEAELADCRAENGIPTVFRVCDRHDAICRYTPQCGDDCKDDQQEAPT